MICEFFFPINSEILFLQKNWPFKWTTGTYYCRCQIKWNPQQQLAYRNNEYAYSVLDNYVLTAGNAGNIVVIINGESRGKAGKSGEVIESLIISSDFNN